MPNDPSIVQALDQDSISSIRRYIEVLIESFPEGLTQKELAEKADVSPSAISKIKERLFPLCDIETLAFDSKLLLKPDIKIFEMVLKEQIVENNLLKALRLVSTEYGEHVIKDIDVHGYLINKIPIYGAFFNEEETKLMTTIFLRFVRSYGMTLTEEEKVGNILGAIRESGFADSLDESFILGMVVGLKFKQVEFNWPVESEEEIRTLIGLRDKLFYISKYLLTRFTENLSIFKSLKKREKKEYKEVCRKIIDYYLTKIFTVFTKSLELTTVKKNLSFDQRYKKTGSLVEKGSMEKVLPKIE